MAKGGIRSKINSPIVRKVLMAAGAVSLATSIAAIVLPNQAQLINNPIVRAGLGFVVGDIPGAAVNFLTAGGLSSITGGSNGGTSSVQGNTGGFA